MLAFQYKLFQLFTTQICTNVKLQTNVGGSMGKYSLMSQKLRNESKPQYFFPDYIYAWWYPFSTTTAWYFYNTVFQVLQDLHKAYVTSYSNKQQ